MIHRGRTWLKKKTAADQEWLSRRDSFTNMEYVLDMIKERLSPGDRDPVSLSKLRKVCTLISKRSFEVAAESPGDGDPYDSMSKPEGAGTVRVAAYGSRKGWKFIDDDWFRFWYPPGTPDDQVGNADTKDYEVHELCTRLRCRYGYGECPWHPAGCECSSGGCQDQRSSRHRYPG